MIKTLPTSGSYRIRKRLAIWPIHCLDIPENQTVFLCWYYHVQRYEARIGWSDSLVVSAWADFFTREAAENFVKTAPERYIGQELAF